MKYRREITPDIKVQADKIFVRNDLFEQVIKSCKATNIEFTMLKKNLAYVIMKKIIIQKRLYKIQDNTDVPSIKEINKVSNKVSTKKPTKKLTKEADNELINELTNKSTNELTNELTNRSTNELTNELTNEKVNSNITSWHNTDKFNKILATIDNYNFNHKNKIGKLKFNDINNLMNSIKGNAISEADDK